MNEIKEGYPLKWPRNWKRTKKHLQQHSRSRQSFAAARDNLLNEIRLLGGKYPIISSNIPLKKDGFPYANYKTPEDTGVAVYFLLYGTQQCIPCDKWISITDNITAIQKTISALRGIERWGAKEMVQAAFKGFTALPDYSNESKEQQKKYFEDCYSFSETKHRYLLLAKKLHPDVIGDDKEFLEMQKQYEDKMNNLYNL